MAITEREKHIKTMENLLSHYKARERCEGYYDGTLKDNVEALEYSISSLKTDLKYDLMYEGEDIYTKSDMVAMLTEIQLEIEELDTPNNGSAYIDCAEIIQQKIDRLRGEIDVKR